MHISPLLWKIWLVLPIPLFILVLILFSMVGGCWGGGQGTPMSAPPPSPPVPEFPIPEPAREAENVPTDILARNVLLQLEEGVLLLVRSLRGEIESLDESGIVVLGDQNGWVLRIFYADIAVTPRILETILSRYLPDALKDLLDRISFEMLSDQRVRITAVVERLGLALPIEITAALRATPEGWLLIHPAEIKFCGVPVKDLLGALDLSIDEIVDLEELAGVRIQGNDILLNPARILPPPPIEGYIASVTVEDSAIVLHYRLGGTIEEERIAELVPPDTTAPNFLYLRHGTVRIRKLYMVQAEAQFIDKDPSDPMWLSHDQYYTQLVAGYSRLLEGLGIQYYVPDFDEVGTTAGPDEEQVDPTKRRKSLVPDKTKTGANPTDADDRLSAGAGRAARRISCGDASAPLRFGEVHRVQRGFRCG